MHVHLLYRSRCSNLAAEDINDNLSKKFDAVCLTDHWLLKARKENPFRDVKVFYGVELGSDMGDILAYGLRSLPIKKKNIPAEKVINFIHMQGGMAICAHPFSNTKSGFGDYLYDYDFDAIEINGSVDENMQEKAQKAANKLDIPTIGGSDAHRARQLNTVGTEFDVPINTMADIVNAIRNKECRVIKI